MSKFLVTNNAESTLAAPISDSDTSVQLAAGTGAEFPSPAAGELFTLTFVDVATGTQTEIAYCTSRTGDVLTITRGEEGTTPQAWGTGDIAGNYCTAGTIEHLVQVDQLQQGTYETVSTVGGTGNAITGTLDTELVAPVDAQSIRLVAGAANTGATTLNLTMAGGALGAVDVVKFNNQALVSGDIPAAGFVALLNYNDTLGKWVLQNPATASTITAAVISAPNYVIAGGTANAITGAFTPAVSALTDGLKLRFKAASANTAAATFKADGTTAKAIKTQYLLDIAPGAITASNEIELTYNLAADVWVMTTAPANAISSGLMATTGGITNITAPSGWSDLTLHLVDLEAATDFCAWMEVNGGIAGNVCNYGNNNTNNGGSSQVQGGSNVAAVAITDNSTLTDDNGTTPNPLGIRIEFTNPSGSTKFKGGTVRSDMSRKTTSPSGLVGSWQILATAAIATVNIFARNAGGSSGPTGSAVNFTGGSWYWTGNR